jgi:hypothetical protein
VSAIADFPFYPERGTRASESSDQDQHNFDRLNVQAMTSSEVGGIIAMPTLANKKKKAQKKA